MKKFIIILILTFAIGVTPSLIVGNSVDGLQLPAFYPPKIVFPIVWSILFILMSISLYRATKTSDRVFLIYFVQLVVNSLWTVIFFGLKLRLFAFIWLVILFALVLIMVKHFYQEDKISAYLQIPYLVWLIIAGYLNLSIYLLN